MKKEKKEDYELMMIEYKRQSKRRERRKNNIDLLSFSKKATGITKGLVFLT